MVCLLSLREYGEMVLARWASGRRQGPASVPFVFGGFGQEQVDATAGIAQELGGPCKPGHTNEEFFGVEYVRGQGWLVSNETTKLGWYLDSSNDCFGGGRVQMVQGLTDCDLWNFPSG
jgi:hypothetical protein